MYNKSVSHSSLYMEYIWEKPLLGVLIINIVEHKTMILKKMSLADTPI